MTTHVSQINIRELAADETHLAHQAIHALKSAYTDINDFVDYVNGVLRPSGYRMVGIFTANQERAVAVASFRTSENLAWGRYLYVDGIFTTADVRQDHTEALFDWLFTEGRKLGCRQLHLDSQMDADHFTKHRLYHSHGLGIYAHHFVRDL